MSECVKCYKDTNNIHEYSEVTTGVNSIGEIELHQTHRIDLCYSCRNAFIKSYVDATRRIK